MDQDQSAAGPELTEGPSAAGPEPTEAHERTPEQVRADIEHTRAELGDTVAALAEKTDVKAQAKQAVDGARETVGDAGQRAKRFAGENTLVLVVIGAFALGWLIRNATSR